MKIITPQIPQWVLPVLEREGLRLCQNPTHEQLKIFRQKVGEYYQEDNRLMFMYDVFVLLFRLNLDILPILPPLTPKQHEALYSRLIISCLGLACKWANDVVLQKQEQDKAQTLEEFINSFAYFPWKGSA